MATDKRKIFEAHGVVFTGETETEWIGRCPFTGKDDKFYVNKAKWLWDSKTAGLSGNIPRFLEHTQRRYRMQMNGDLLAKLALDRKLPIDAFTPFGFGWNGQAYTLGVRDATGLMVDIRTYKRGGRMLSTAGCNVGLLNAHLIPAEPAAPIYICEGEWDCIAWSWVRDRMNAPGVVVGVPGASTFKPEWAAAFAGRTAHCLCDNDEAGHRGNDLIAKRIATTVQKLTVLDWPTGLPDGYDIRDWVVFQALEEKDIKKAWTLIHQRLIRHQDSPRKKSASGTSTGSGKTADVDDEPTPLEKERAEAAKRPSAWADRPPDLDDLERVYRKWLFLENMDAVHVMMATLISLAIDGPPVWLFLVSPPGGAKTEILTTLSSWQDIYTTSSLTTHSLISGSSQKEGHDPSLIPRLDGKVMVIKDFTAILTLRDTDKDEIFGTLRDAYDGSCGKVFGNGVERNYTSRFGVLAAVTPSIYDMGSRHTSLGERFLKFGIGDNLYHRNEKNIVRKAINNISHETNMRFELSDVTNAFLAKISTAVLPTIPKNIEDKLIHLAMFGARMRGSVSRDTYKNDIIVSRPSSEVPSRLGIQLAKEAKALALVFGNSEVGEREYRILRKIILDTIPQRNEDLIRHLLRACPNKGDLVTAQHMAVETRYPAATIVRLLQDFNVLEIVTRAGNVMRSMWGISDYIRECIDHACLYRTDEERQRATRIAYDSKSKAKSAPVRVAVHRGVNGTATAAPSGLPPTGVRVRVKKPAKPVAKRFSAPAPMSPTGPGRKPV